MATNTYVKGNITKKVWRPVELTVPFYIKFNGVISNTRYELAVSRPGAVIKAALPYIKTFTTNGATSTTATLQLVGDFRQVGATSATWLGLGAAVAGATGFVYPDTVADIGANGGLTTNISAFAQYPLGGAYDKIALDIAGGTSAQDTIIEGELHIVAYEFVSEDTIEPVKTVEFGRIGLGSAVNIDIADTNGPVVLVGTAATAATASIYNFTDAT